MFGQTFETILYLFWSLYSLGIEMIKVSGPFVETSCVFQCIKNIINAEMWAWKNDYN